MINDKPGTTKFRALDKFFDAPQVSDYARNKSAYEKASKSFLRQLLKDITAYIDSANSMTVENAKVHFNPGGTAIAGDPSLYLTTDNNSGICVYISETGFKARQPILWRTIKHMKDYTGGANNWQSVDDPYNEIVKHLAAALK